MNNQIYSAGPLLSTLFKQNYFSNDFSDKKDIITQEPIQDGYKIEFYNINKNLEGSYIGSYADLFSSNHIIRLRVLTNLLNSYQFKYIYNIKDINISFIIKNLDAPTLKKINKEIKIKNKSHKDHIKAIAQHKLWQYLFSWTRCK